jgi:hypothetical protein
MEESKYDYIKRIILSDYKKDEMFLALGVKILIPIPYNDFKFFDFYKLLSSIREEIKIRFNYKLSYSNEYYRYF